MTKAVNDIGGENWGKVALQNQPTPHWAKLATALRGALGEHGARLVSLHEGRRAREELDFDRYHSLGYFELGAQAIHDILVEKGILTEQEIRERIDILRGKLR